MGHRRFRASLALLSGVMISAQSDALTITLNFDSGQSLSPGFDPSGAQLQTIMQEAAIRWQRVIGLGHNLTINYWYEDIGSLGSNTTVAFVGDRTTVADIRIDTQDGGSPLLYFFDPTPSLDEEFSMQQRLYGGLSATQQADFFDGTPPDLFEVGYNGGAELTAPNAARNGYDMLTIALHEIGHAMGVPPANPANTEVADRDFDFRSSLIGGATAAAKADGFLNLDTDHLADDFSLMTGGLPIGQRRRISATDVLAADAVSQWVILNLYRKEFLGTSGVLYNDSSNWVGGLVPLNLDMVDVRHGGQAFLGDDSLAGDLNVSGSGTDLVSFAFDMTVSGHTQIDGGGEMTLANNFSGQNGVLNTGTLAVGPTAASTLELDGGEALVDGDMLINLGSTVTGNGTIQVGGDLANGGTIRVLGDGKTLSLETTGVGRLVLDGFAGPGGNGKIFVGNNSDAVLLAVNAPLADDFSGDLTLTSGGRADFDSPWSTTTSADLFFSGGGSLEGGKVDFNGILQVNSGSGRITAPIDFEPFTRVVFSQLNSELELFGMTDYIGWNSINPTNGTLRQTGDAFFSGAITLGVNIYDMDGRNESSFITIGNDVTINAAQLDMADNVFNGNLEITEPAKLTINTPAAWEMAGTMALIGAFNAGPEPVLLDGSRMVLSGMLEADGHSQIDAPITIAAGGQIEFPNVGGGSRGLVLGGASHEIEGGSVTGDGSLGAVSGASLIGKGAISSDVDFDSNSQLLADNGTLTISGTVQHAGILGTAGSGGVLDLTLPLVSGVVDELRLNGGTIQGANISHAGTTSGSGNINVNRFSTTGTTSPGLSFGVLNFTDDYNQTAGTTVIEVGGTTPGTSADQITVGDDATIAGILELQTAAGYNPQLLTSYQILTAGNTLTGTYAQVQGVTISPGKSWAVTYGSNAVSITAAIPGDSDLDGDVDDSDLGTAFANYTGPVGASGGKTFIDGDTDGDGDVDDSDLGSAFANYTGPLTPANVPEPTSLVILAWAALSLSRRRRDSA